MCRTGPRSAPPVLSPYPRVPVLLLVVAGRIKAARKVLVVLPVFDAVKGWRWRRRQQRCVLSILLGRGRGGSFFTLIAVIVVFAADLRKEKQRVSLDFAMQRRIQMQKRDNTHPLVSRRHYGCDICIWWWWLLKGAVTSSRNFLCCRRLAKC